MMRLATRIRVAAVLALAVVDVESVEYGGLALRVR